MSEPIATPAAIKEIETLAKALVAMAEDRHVVLSIEVKSRQPLAMGNHEMIVDAYSEIKY